MNTTAHFYKGKTIQEVQAGVNDNAGGELFIPPDPYLPDEKLVKVIQFAQLSGRPLLLKGEPGCGKTKAAEAVAYELFGREYKKYYFEWPVKSGSKAQEGLYTINYLQRLQDATIQKAGNKEKKDLDIRLPEDKMEGDYIKLGELGKAFRLSNTMAAHLPSPVVLIDEIDKADIDFPNDLLLELERMEFRIPEAKNELGKEVVVRANKNRRPLIIITSNDEKTLPPAFLRRCMFHYIEFPSPVELFKIVRSRNFKKLSQEGLSSLSRLFSALRFAITNQGTASKNISTSELLDWVFIIDLYHREHNNLFEIENTDSVLKFLKEYAPALAKDEATKKMIDGAKEGSTFVSNTIDKYKYYRDQSLQPATE